MVDREKLGTGIQPYSCFERSHRFFIVHRSIGRLVHYPAFITLSGCTAGEWSTRGTVLN